MKEGPALGVKISIPTPHQPTKFWWTSDTFPTFVGYFQTVLTLQNKRAYVQRRLMRWRCGSQRLAPDFFPDTPNTTVVDCLDHRTVYRVAQAHTSGTYCRKDMSS